MSRIPSAWDDGWEQSADAAAAAPAPAPRILSKSERKAAHVEANKKLWDAAEQPEVPYFLNARDNVPLKSDFKPQVKVLSRKPTPQVTGTTSTTIGADDDSEEEERRRAAESFAERQRRAALEREEKQRKYAEARERILGASTPAPGSNSSRQQGRRGGGQAARSGSRHGSSAEQSPARGSGQHPKTLFDPGFSAKPTEGRPPPRSGTPHQEQPIRMPRGPDGSGRGGFAPRGGRGG
ncbi:hypothetical protein ANO11243_041540 [Dothideomycetidae sp. 11243]|nr:hypothetical protein ANO11243_041540 [fungal sp. No.11243]